MHVNHVNHVRTEVEKRQVWTIIVVIMAESGLLIAQFAFTKMATY